MKHYSVKYSNTAASGHADVTDRVYRYGTITNTRIPQTGDSTDVIGLTTLSGASLLCLLLLLRKSRRKEH